MLQLSDKPQISSVFVQGLYGRFNHDLEFPESQNIIIIHAPNGFGKTVTLKLIDSLFKRRFSSMARVDFTSITVRFRDNSTLSVSPVRKKQSTKTADTEEEANYRDLQFSAVDGRSKSRHEHTIRPSKFVNRSELRQSIEHIVPHLDRIGVNKWRDLLDGTVLNFDDVANLYGDNFPETGEHGSIPTWLDRFLLFSNTRLIETQRLLQIGNERRYPRRVDRPEGTTSVVYKQARELASNIERTFTSYSVKSQKLDQSFPQRVLTKIANRENPRDEAVLRNEIEGLEKKRSYLTEAGLLTHVEALPPLSAMEISPDLRQVLEVYVEDTTEKLDIFDDMFERIRLFKEIVNSKFRFKSIDVDRERGVLVKSEKGEPLPLSVLSSGEQHELVLAYELIFESNANSFLLIDEPEISLHVAWQKRFLPDLLQIMKINKFQAVIATHSPQIIGDFWNLTNDLGRQTLRDDEFDPQ